MTDTWKSGLLEKDSDQVIATLKKGSYLLKYGRRGKPKFCPFRLSNDESLLVWYTGNEEKHIKLSHVLKIIPGQCTAIFQRYPQPKKEYQSFSLICNDRTLDLICKDKDEAEVWFVGLNALITHRGKLRKWRTKKRCDSLSIDIPQAHTQRNSPPIKPFDPEDKSGGNIDNVPSNRLGKAFADIISCTATTKNLNHAEPVANPSPPSSVSYVSTDNPNGRDSSSEATRVSISSAISSSSQGSYQDDFDALGDVFIWGEGIGRGILGGGVDRVENSLVSKIDALLPKALESSMVHDVQNIACGGRHAVLVTKQGEIFSWGEEAGGRLGQGVEADISQPKLIDFLSGMNIELVACGEYHTCAVTLSGDFYTWGGDTYHYGLLGHGSEASHWIPKRVSDHIDGLRVSHVSCGPCHTAAVTSAGQLFTFGDGSFGALGHGDLSSSNIPREVETLRGLRTIRIACGVWHTAAVVEIIDESSSPEISANSSSGKLYTWGDGDKGQLGHGDTTSRLYPECLTALMDKNICQVACGHNLTVALTASGQVYTMGSSAYGQLGNPSSDGKVPTRVEGKILDIFVEEVACGSYHVAVLTSKTKVYTWGKGSNGQLGHGDNDHRNTPTLVDFLKDKRVRSVVCGSNLTAIICLHKWASGVDHSVCSGCYNPFGFRRKRHNCYNCGLVFCKACSSRKSLKASLAPYAHKSYRVCGDCFVKLKKTIEAGSTLKSSKVRNENMCHKSMKSADGETRPPRLQAVLSKLASFGSVSLSENRLSKSDNQPEAHCRRVFPTLDGNSRLQDFDSLKAAACFIGVPKNGALASNSSLRMFSRAPSPLSRLSSPCQFSKEFLEESKHPNESLNQEVMILRSQVEDLTQKSQHLEAELDKTTKQLKEVTAIAAEEAEKCESAKEVIRSLTAQLKDIAERLPGHTVNFTAGPSKGHDTDHLHQLSMDTSSKNVTPDTESSNNSTVRNFPSGTKIQAAKTERVVRDEPGVYLTLTSLPDGSSELRRVRFSRRHFKEEQAEKWWAENGTKVCERHNVRVTEKHASSTAIIQQKRREIKN